MAKSAQSSDIQALCMALVRADTEAKVITLLSAAGYWDDPHMWRYLGDDDNNFATIGNQQSEAVAALIEKIINSVDARLMNACLETGIDPASPAAPQSIREAVAVFFEGRKVNELGEKDGRVAFWIDEKTKAEGLLLTVAATGNTPEKGGWPSITVADQGEGQTPDNFPTTFMSLHRSNKLRIPFVQGKFNMGGTGVFQFSDTRHRVQLVVSRRNPVLLSGTASSRDREWGFTIVRRQAPSDGRRSSVFTYLAPVGADATRQGGVLSFPAQTLPILPEASAKIRDAYHRHASHGALVKMYEYKWQGTKSNIIQARDGLLRRLDQGLPELALPVRVFECRPNYRGGPGSFATNLLGLAARLERDRAEKLEPGFPCGSIIDVAGQKVRARVFAFTKGTASEYRTARHGVIFTINGQAHASLPIDFFRSDNVGMSYLATSLLCTVDCSGIEGEAREDLFMNSRDRLRDNTLSRRLVDDLAARVHGESALKTLRNKRREAELEDRLSDSKPLADVLRDLVKRSPLLEKLFLKGMKVPSPFPPGVGKGPAGTAKNPGPGPGDGEFKGKEYPTYFHFRDLAPGKELRRQSWVGTKVHVQFQTDADNDYLIRDLFPGEMKVWRILDDGAQVPLDNTRMDGPSSGLASLHLDLPDDATVGSVVTLEVEISDDMRIDPFVNRLILDVHDARQSGGGGGGGGRRKTNGGGGGGGLDLPNIIPVKEEDWGTHSFHTFTEDSALAIVNAGGDDATDDVFDFYVNVDNKHLRTAQKESTKVDPKLLEAKFTYSLVLLGLALINEDQAHRKGAGRPELAEDAPDSFESVEAFVARATSALASVLLPMVETIGGLALPED